MEIDSENELFELLGKFQSDRLDEQRCNPPEVVISVANDNREDNIPVDSSTMPENYAMRKTDSIDLEPIKQVLASGGPYPLVVLPVSGEYWLEGSNHQCPASNGPNLLVPHFDIQKCFIEVDQAVDYYRKYFLGKEHFNFMCDDERLGPVIMSIKQEVDKPSDPETQGFVRVILRSFMKFWCQDDVGTIGSVLSTCWMKFKQVYSASCVRKIAFIQQTLPALFIYDNGCCCISPCCSLSGTTHDRRISLPLVEHDEIALHPNHPEIVKSSPLFNVGSSFSCNSTAINGSRRCATLPPLSISALFSEYSKLKLHGLERSRNRRGDPEDRTLDL